MQHWQQLMCTEEQNNCAVAADCRRNTADDCHRVVVDEGTLCRGTIHLELHRCPATLVICGDADRHAISAAAATLIFVLMAQMRARKRQSSSDRRGGKGGIRRPFLFACYRNIRPLPSQKWKERKALSPHSALKVEAMEAVVLCLPSNLNRIDCH